MHREWNDDDAHLRSTARNLLSKSRFRLLLPSLVHRPASAKCRSTRRTRRTVQNQVASFRRDKKLRFSCDGRRVLVPVWAPIFAFNNPSGQLFCSKKGRKHGSRGFIKWITFQCSETISR